MFGFLLVLSGLSLASTSLFDRDVFAWSNPNTTCSILAHKFPNQIEYPGSANYTTDTTAYWSFRGYLDPNCVFAPLTSEDLAAGVKILAATNTSFTVRSGGHSPIAGINNINNGVLIVTNNFNDSTLIPTPNSWGVSAFVMGANQRWGPMYSLLDQHNQTITGGRVYSVGSSALLGGGISYTANRHGWSSDSVLNFELVTGEGKVLQISNKTYPDLYWALKAGQNNYGIVTRYTLQTYLQGPVFGGTIDVLPSAFQDYLDAQQAYINPGGGIEDLDAAIMPGYNYVPAANQTNATWIGMHNTPEINPKAFENFTKLANTSSSANVGLMSFSSFVEQSETYQGSIARGNWFATAMKITNNTMNFQYQTLYDTANKIVPGLDVIVGLSSEPITQTFIQESINNGGDPIDLDPANGSFVIALCYALWFDESQDAIMETYLETLISNLDTATKADGSYYPFIFNNNAGNTQLPFTLYGAGKSLPKMKAIAEKYDPQGVFQRLVPGFKLNGPVTNLHLSY